MYDYMYIGYWGNLIVGVDVGLHMYIEYWELL